MGTKESIYDNHINKDSNMRKAIINEKLIPKSNAKRSFVVF